MSFATSFIESALKANSPEAQLERDVVTQHFNTQAKLANVQVSEAISKIADKIDELKAKDNASPVAIAALERLMVQMSS